MWLLKPLPDKKIGRPPCYSATIGAITAKLLSMKGLRTPSSRLLPVLVIMVTAAVSLESLAFADGESQSSLTAQMAENPSKGLTLVALGVCLVIFAVFRKRLFSC